MISIVENSNKFQNTRFWKEKSVEGMVTLGPMAHVTLVVMDCHMPTDEMMSCKINKLIINNSEVNINILFSLLN
jgi:hypothetical protein